MPVCRGSRGNHESPSQGWCRLGLLLGTIAPPQPEPARGPKTTFRWASRGALWAATSFLITNSAVQPRTPPRGQRLSVGPVRCARSPHSCCRRGRQAVRSTPTRPRRALGPEAMLIAYAAERYCPARGAWLAHSSGWRCRPSERLDCCTRSKMTSHRISNQRLVPMYGPDLLADVAEDRILRASTRERRIPGALEQGGNFAYAICVDTRVPSARVPP